MTNAEMIKALRCCASLDTPCKGLCPYYGVEYCQTKKDLDAADAIEQLNHLVSGCMFGRFEDVMDEICGMWNRRANDDDN